MDRELAALQQRISSLVQDSHATVSEGPGKSEMSGATDLDRRLLLKARNACGVKSTPTFKVVD